MAYSVNWSTKVVTIPKTDLEVVSVTPEVYSLDVTDLWQTLIDIQDDTDGMTYLDIVLNTPPLSAAGVTLARVIQIINGYTLTFEDGLYAVNVIGGNSNVADVVNKNQVSVNTSNSAGLVEVGNVSVDFDDLLDGETVEGSLSVRQALRLLLSAMAGKVSGAGGTTVAIRDTLDSKDRIVATVDASGNRTNVTLDPT